MRIKRNQAIILPSGNSTLIPASGGYQNLKSYQISQLIFDFAIRFCDRYIDKRSRTHDQMVQAARSGVQNIAEGSLAAATSKKTELKLTNVARASQGELKLDYEDYLRQRGKPLLGAHDPILQRFKKRRCRNLQEIRDWVIYEHHKSGRTGGTMLQSDTLAANAVLSLLNLSMFLLNRQIQRLADDFEKEGGFTERLYRIRKSKRSRT